MDITEIKDYLKNYDGREITLMEVCGSHTAAIAKFGIKGLLSPKIRLISGPGCPVCVTPAAYVDRLIGLSLEPGTTVATFGDLMRVPGSKESLALARSRGAKVEMVYSPMDVLDLATAKPDERYIFAAVGFETTAPVYALLVSEIRRRGIENIKLLTSIKTMPPVIESLMADRDRRIDGFIAPGHVCAVTGSNYFVPLAEKFDIPFGVSGFEAKELLIAIAGIVRMVAAGENEVRNYYTSVVTPAGNEIAMKRLDEIFEKADALWRGMGIIKGSALVLRPEYSDLDLGSGGILDETGEKNGCRCGEVLAGKLDSEQCPLFGKVCTPSSPMGACMVSFEGSCYQKFINK